MSDDVTFRRREFKGSRLRCLIATSLADCDVAAFFNQLVQPHALVSAKDTWQPRGLLEGDEARLGEAAAFLTADQREALTDWWLAVRERANTPNWDIVSTCQVDGRQGLVVVEAKAHSGELHRDGKDPGNEANDKCISAAVAAANDALGGSAAGWNLWTDTHYQLCNRFAWAWKVASLGIPVVLVYLGFLDSDEMGDGAFRTPEAWRSCLLAHADGVVPPSAWEQRLPAGSSWFVPMIRAARVSAVAVEATHA
jgi:hypothetical protein